MSMSYDPWEPRDASTGLAPPPADPPFQSPVQEHRGPLRRLGGGIVAGGLLVLKFVGQGAILLKFKFLFTFALAVGAYALFWGWWFGLGFAVLLSGARARARDLAASARGSRRRCRCSSRSWAPSWR